MKLAIIQDGQWKQLVWTIRKKSIHSLNFYIIISAPLNPYVFFKTSFQKLTWPLYKTYQGRFSPIHFKKKKKIQFSVSIKET